MPIFLHSRPVVKFRAQRRFDVLKIRSFTLLRLLSNLRVAFCIAIIKHVALLPTREVGMHSDLAVLALPRTVTAAGYSLRSNS